MTMTTITPEFYLNSSVNSETGTTLYMATFGDSEQRYLQLDEHATLAQKMTSYMTHLQQDLDSVMAASKAYQTQLALQRTSTTPTGTSNQFVPGDLVLRRVQLHPGEQGARRPNKLALPFTTLYYFIPRSVYRRR